LYPTSSSKTSFRARSHTRASRGAIPCTTSVRRTARVASSLPSPIGPDGVAGATYACAIKAFGDAAVALIRGHIDQARAAANPQALDAVSGSAVGTRAAAGGHEAAHRANEEAAGAGGAGGGGAAGSGAAGGVTLDDALVQAAYDHQDRESKDAGRSESAGGGKGGGGNWLMMIAQNLAKACDEFAKEMIAASAAMAESAGEGATPNAGADGGGAGSTEFLQANARLSSASQMFSTCMNALSTIIKTIGEGCAGVSRKQ